MKPGYFAGAALALLLCQPAVAQTHQLHPPFSVRLPEPPRKPKTTRAQPLTSEEQQMIQAQQTPDNANDESGSYNRLMESRESSTNAMPGLSQYEPGAKGFTGQPTRPDEPIDITLVSPAEEQVMATSTVRLVLDVQNFIMAKGGNRLHVILDGGSPHEYYTSKLPITFTGLAPGGHTLRIYAVGPDGRMLKTPGSYLIRHFFVKRQDVNNYTAPDKPYLTVNLPPEGTVIMPTDGKVWLDIHAHNVKLANEGGYTVHYRINGLHNQVTTDQGIFWANLQPGTYELEVMLKDPEGRTIPGIFGGARRKFTLQESYGGSAPPGTVTPLPKVVFDQVPGYDPNPISIATTEAGYPEMSGDGSGFQQMPGAAPQGIGTSAVGEPIPTAPKEPQRLIRSAPAATEEQAEEANKDNSVIDLDAQ